MQCLCQRCGTSKQNPNQTCSSCQFVPWTETEKAKAYLLSELVLTAEGLQEAAKVIRSGKAINFPPEAIASMIDSIREARASNNTQPPQQQQPQYRSSPPVYPPQKEISLARSILIIVTLLAIGVVWFFHVDICYAFAKYKHEVSAYELFIATFPNSGQAQSAKRAVHLLKEDSIWEAAKVSRNIQQVRKYVKDYSRGKYLDEAKTKIRELGFATWDRMRTSTSRQQLADMLNAFPEIQKEISPEVNKRIVELALTEWETVKTSSSRTPLKNLLDSYPEAKDEISPLVSKRITEIAFERWETIKKSRSNQELRSFLSQYPEAYPTMGPLVEARFKELHADITWIKEQDNLKIYRMFAQNYPKHPRIKEVEKRIIDLEVAEIAAGDYGEMPKAERMGYGKSRSRVNISVENQTGHELTVRYSGPESTKLVIPIGETRSASVSPGDYKIAASVAAYDVRNYFGSDSLEGGNYSSSFYISTSTLPSGFDYPLSFPNRGRR